MILIADSGATKTDWYFVTHNEIIRTFKTEGINPFLQREDEIDHILLSSDLPLIAQQTYDVFYYGAGCNYEDKIATVRNSLKKVFSLADITVNHDMLAAARALCQQEAGLACILGTGSNACFYDGENITWNSPSLGYILGDEGSGTYLGKKLLQDFIYGNLPASLKEKFCETFDLTTDAILDNVYKNYLPNRFLASFSAFIYENIKHPYMYGLVYESFYDFLDRHVVKYDGYENYKTNFIGSIAYYYQDILKKVCADLEITSGKIIEAPIQELTKYHQKLLNE